MHAAKCRAHSGVFLDEGDAAVKIVRTEQDVIEQPGNLGNLGPRRQGVRRRDGSRGEHKKASARDVVHDRLLLASKITRLGRDCGALRASWLARADVGSPALVLDFRRIGLTLERIFDGEAHQAEVALYFFPAEPYEVERALVAPAVFSMTHFMTTAT